jgi:hypothetical protein
MDDLYTTMMQRYMPQGMGHSNTGVFNRPQAQPASPWSAGLSNPFTPPTSGSPYMSMNQGSGAPPSTAYGAVGSTPQYQGQGTPMQPQAGITQPQAGINLKQGL